MFVAVGSKVTVLKPEDGVNDAEEEESDAVTGLLEKLLVGGIEVERTGEEDATPVPYDEGT